MDFSVRHSFAINKAFLKKEASSAEDYLNAVLEVEKDISKYAVENDNEIFWKQNDLKFDESLGYGTSGIAYFYIQLFEATGDEKFLQIVRKAVNHIAKNWKTIIPAEPHKYTWPDGMHYGIYSGIGGIGSVLLIARKFFKSKSDFSAIKTIENALDEIFDYLKSKAKRTENGIIWTGSTVSLADGGIIMFLTSLFEEKPSEELKEFLEKAGNAYLSFGIEHDNGGLEYSDFETCKLSELDYPYKVSQPNFELGSAGVGFNLVRLYEVFKDEKYLSAAKKVEVYLDSIKIEQKKGFLLPYRVGEHEEIFFYLGNCHGVAGTSKFYYILNKVTGEKKYLDKVHALFDGFESLGAPNVMSKGFWNNTSVCCGHGGVLNTSIGLYEQTNDERWLSLAKTSASILLGEKDEVEKGYHGWPIAYRRIAPTEFSYTIFYNDGTAGIAAALLRIYFTLKGKKNPNSLLDDPFRF